MIKCSRPISSRSVCGKLHDSSQHSEHLPYINVGFWGFSLWRTTSLIRRVSAFVEGQRSTITLCTTQCTCQSTLLNPHSFECRFKVLSVWHCIQSKYLRDFYFHDKHPHKFFHFLFPHNRLQYTNVT
jgi:hypothetical protein